MNTWETMKAEYRTETLADELTDYSGYVCDAICEIADSNVSIYTLEQQKFALENTEETADAVNEFGLEPSKDFGEYVARAGAMAWFARNEREIYDNLEKGIAFCVVCDLEKEYRGEAPNLDAWDYVKNMKKCDWEDSSELIEDITDEAKELYTEFIETYSIQGGQR